MFAHTDRSRRINAGLLPTRRSGAEGFSSRLTYRHFEENPVISGVHMMLGAKRPNYAEAALVAVGR